MVAKMGAALSGLLSVVLLVGCSAIPMTREGKSVELLTEKPPGIASLLATLSAHKATGLRETIRQTKISSSAPETTCAIRRVKWAETMSGCKTQIIPTRGAAKARQTPRFWVLSIAVNKSARLRSV